MSFFFFRKKEKVTVNHLSRFANREKNQTLLAPLQLPSPRACSPARDSATSPAASPASSASPGGGAPAAPASSRSAAASPPAAAAASAGASRGLDDVVQAHVNLVHHLEVGLMLLVRVSSREVAK